MKGSDVPDDQATTITLKQITESLSMITIEYWNPKVGSALFAEAELRKDTLPWTITIKTETSGDYSAHDATQLWQDSWILVEMLEELTGISDTMVIGLETFLDEIE